MPVTPRVGLPYPAEDEDPHYASFEAMVRAIDESLYAAREDRQIILICQDNPHFNPESGELSWGAPLEIQNGVTGTVWRLPAGKVKIPDGHFLWVEIPRAPENSVDLVPRVDAILPAVNRDGQLVVAVRKGTRIWFRDGFRAGEGGDLPGGGRGSILSRDADGNLTPVPLTETEEPLVLGSDPSKPAGIAYRPLVDFMPEGSVGDALLLGPDRRLRFGRAGGGGSGAGLKIYESVEALEAELPAADNPWTTALVNYGNGDNGDRVWWVVSIGEGGWFQVDKFGSGADSLADRFVSNQEFRLEREVYAVEAGDQILLRLDDREDFTFTFPQTTTYTPEELAEYLKPSFQASGLYVEYRSDSNEVWIDYGSEWHSVEVLPGTTPSLGLPVGRYAPFLEASGVRFYTPEDLPVGSNIGPFLFQVEWDASPRITIQNRVNENWEEVADLTPRTIPVVGEMEPEPHPKSRRAYLREDGTLYASRWVPGEDRWEWSEVGKIGGSSSALTNPTVLAQAVPGFHELDGHATPLIPIPGDGEWVELCTVRIDPSAYNTTTFKISVLGISPDGVHPLEVQFIHLYGSLGNSVWIYDTALAEGLDERAITAYVTETGLWRVRARCQASAPEDQAGIHRIELWPVNEG